MRKIGTFYIGSLALVIGACSSSNGADQGGGVGGSGASGNGTGTGNASASLGGDGFAALGGAGQTLGGAAQNLGGAGQNLGGAGQTLGGAGQTVGGANSTGTGGSTSCGPAACGTDSCGVIIDGCGNAVDCGACATGSYCNIDGLTPNLCTACAATSCATAGAVCGYLQDGCNNLLDCNPQDANGVDLLCPTGTTCGAITPNQCDPTGATTVTCVNFCNQQVTNCPVGTTTTTMTGTVLAPNGTLPLPNALVYVPNGSTTYPYGITTFVDGVGNNGCECSVSGTPLVQTTTGVDGTFTLTNVPAGTDIPLVIQLGRWRRVITVPAVTSCATTAIATTLTQLPSRQGMGSTMDAIPLMALSTGAVDAMECVLRKMGIEDSQFSNAGGTGRIRFYRDNGASCTTGGGACTGTTPNYLTGANALTASQANVDQYDALIFPCDGASHDVAGNAKSMVLDAAANMNAYTNKGGRAFFTHFSYAWLYNQQPAINLPWRSTTSSAAVDNPSSTTHHDPATNVQIDTTFARGLIFSQWLALPAVNALAIPTPPQISVLESRWDMNNLATWNNAGAAQRWAFYTNDTPQAAIMHVTFDTPWNIDPKLQCGRVLYSDYHVTASSAAWPNNTQPACITGTGAGASYTNCSFPTECSLNFTAQEKTLAYFMFDMTSCVKPPPIITCTKKTCADYGATCGQFPDGCDGKLDCGICQCVPQTCEAACPAGQCQTVNDGKKFVLPCQQVSKCTQPPTISCYCPIG